MATKYRGHFVFIYMSLLLYLNIDEQQLKYKISSYKYYKQNF